MNNKKDDEETETDDYDSDMNVTTNEPLAVQERGTTRYHDCTIQPEPRTIPSIHHELDNRATRIIPIASESSEENDTNEDERHSTRIPPKRPPEAFLDLECWLEHGCKPSNPEYTEWLRKCVDSEYAFICLDECWQGRGRYERNNWNVAKIMANGHYHFENLREDEYESAKDRAYSMLHNWLQEGDNDCSHDAWQVAEKALPLFHDCLQEAENLDRLNPRLDVSRKKVGKCRSAVWAAYAEASRGRKDKVGDELLLLLIVYELLRDLKREDSESDIESESSDGSVADCTTSDEDQVHGKKAFQLPKERNDKQVLTDLVNDEAMSSSDDSSYACDGSVSTISTRVPCEGRGARFKAIALMDILLSNTTSDQWEPDFDVDLLQMIVEALGAGTDNPLNMKVILPALSKVLSYWACRPSDFDDDHWDILREILPALEALKGKWSEVLPSDAVDQTRPKKRARRATRSQKQKDPNHLHHLRSEKVDALSTLKKCASSFPAVPPNRTGAASDLTNCIETLTWVLDEKCLEWMLDSEWRPEMTNTS